MIGLLGARKLHQHMLAPEVIQTSAMDCGPAALKCLLDGFGIPVSYGRLREACQTDIDGTSINVIEALANEMGVVAEQSVLPNSVVFAKEATALPALVVVRKPDGAAHFVVVWSRHANRLQIMDPAVGRRWVSVHSFQTEVYRHETSVKAKDWRDWAGSDEFLQPTRKAIERLIRSQTIAAAIVVHACADDRWFRLAALDATLRLVQSLIDSGGVRPGRHAEDLLVNLYNQTVLNPDDIFGCLPQAYWSVVPDLSNSDPDVERLSLSGAVVLSVSGRRPDVVEDQERAAPEDSARLSALATTLHEKPLNPITTLWDMLKEDGLLAPLALVGAMVLSAGAVLVQLVLFKAFMDVSLGLNLGLQRAGALLLLAVFLNILMMIEIPIVMETQRLGRRLEMRLRIALLEKLPKLDDRYFHSRPVSDMAERSHSLYQSRLAPGLGLHLVQAAFSLIFTLAAIFLIDPASLLPALLIAAAAITLPLLIQPMLSERDLAVRNHLGALNGIYLDAMLGLMPIRTHAAQGVVSGVHEDLLTQWSRAGQKLIGLATGLNLVQSLICTGAAAALLYAHFLKAGELAGADLLLVFWTLRLPSIGGELSGLAQQYPAQRNVLARMMEPLSAPESHQTVDESPLPPVATPAASICLSNVRVLAGGHVILDEINLTLRPGEHVAIVGSSGAGKSTLFGLLMGWRSPNQGQLSVDGVCLRGEALDRLRQQTAWVDPMVHLWDQSFLNNLTYAVDAPEPNRVDPVLEASQLRPVLHKLPQGLQTYLGEGGGRLSGGEGQRLRLGRALMQTGVRLALLDEPFRGLDRSMRMRLMREARQWWRDATLLCVSHDIAETLSFDRVLVIEGGKIVEDGPPHILRARASRYRSLLDIEEQLNRDMWGSEAWRRIVLSDGKIIADDHHNRSPASDPEADQHGH